MPAESRGNANAAELFHTKRNRGRGRRFRWVDPFAKREPVPEPRREPSFIEIRRRRLTRRDAIEIGLTIGAALGFLTVLIWIWPSLP